MRNSEQNSLGKAIGFLILFVFLFYLISSVVGALLSFFGSITFLGLIFLIILFSIKRRF